jgi:hypothetical protein
MLRAAPAIRTGGRIAQLVEQLTLNQRVQGSSPCAPTNSFKDLAAGGEVRFNHFRRLELKRFKIDPDVIVIDFCRSMNGSP